MDTKAVGVIGLGLMGAALTERLQQPIGADDPMTIRATPVRGVVEGLGRHGHHGMPWARICPILWPSHDAGSRPRGWDLWVVRARRRRAKAQVPMERAQVWM